MASINECGIFEDYETVVLAFRTGRYYAAVHIIEHDGRWYWGAECEIPGKSTGAGGICFLPGIHWKSIGAVSQTKEMAIAAGREWAVGHVAAWRHPVAKEFEGQIRQLRLF